MTAIKVGSRTNLTISGPGNATVYTFHNVAAMHYKTGKLCEVDVILQGESKTVRFTDGKELPAHSVTLYQPTETQP